MHKYLPVWKFILQHLEAGQPVMLLIVTESAGSSPGRQGFKMAVGANDLYGSIGGGIMEVKLVEHAKSLLHDQTDTIIKHQVHRKDVAYDQSGMICSGEQTIVYIKLSSEHLELIHTLIDCLEQDDLVWIKIEHVDNHLSFKVEKLDVLIEFIPFEKLNNSDFRYCEQTGYENKLFIIGGGHCALALSEVMSRFDFYITVLDDRPELNTLHRNTFAQRKQVLESYEQVDEFVTPGPNVYAVIMTLGYRSDFIALTKLITLPFTYIGLLGSKSKVSTLLSEIEKDGIQKEFIERLHAPIGIPIDSHTPEEIAISIAAEIIRHKNQSYD